jgi:hypothetical protein
MLKSMLQALAAIDIDIQAISMETLNIHSPLETNISVTGRFFSQPADALRFV